MKPGSSALHRPASQQTAFPDVCKTPSPGGPIPIPYANLVDAQADSGNEAARHQRKVIIERASKGSYRPASATQAAIGSQGNEAGARKGAVNASTHGRTHFLMYSLDVKVEGAPVVLTNDMNRHAR